MTKKELLKANIQEFKDKENNSVLIPFKRITTKQGFSYILKDNTKKKNISCAIHLNVSYNYTELKGNLREVYVDISTREKLLSVDFLCEYQDLIIFIKEYSGYNETFKQYMYKGKALTRDKLSLMKELDDVYGYSLFDKISKLEKFTILPKYLALQTNFNDKVVLYEKISSQPLTLLRDDINSLSQTLIEDVDFILVNFSRLEVMQFIKSLENLSLFNQEFGFSGNYNISEINDVDTYSNLNGITYKINLKLCYNIEMKEDKENKLINTIIFRMEDKNGFS